METDTIDWIVENKDFILIRIKGNVVFSGLKSEMNDKIRFIYKEFNYIPTLEIINSLLERR